MSIRSFGNAAENYISDLKAKAGVTKDSDLAIALGVGRSTIASWRRRGEIPIKLALAFDKRFGLSYGDYVGGDRSTFGDTTTFLVLAYNFAILRLGQSLKTDDELKQASVGMEMVGERLRSLFVVQRTPDMSSADFMRATKQVLLDVYDGKKGSVEELRELLSFILPKQG